jgi:hypothetical protein
MDFQRLATTWGTKQQSKVDTRTDRNRKYIRIRIPEHIKIKGKLVTG